MAQSSTLDDVDDRRPSDIVGAITVAGIRQMTAGVLVDPKAPGQLDEMEPNRRR
jgi:hypothetical protein